MGLENKFKSFGHAIAAGAKYFASVLVPDAIKVASKAEKLQPEADALIGAIAGPQASKIFDSALYIFGEAANAIVPLSQDQLQAVSANGLNLKLDTSVVNDVKQLAGLIDQILKARGTPAPKPQ